MPRIPPIDPIPSPDEGTPLLAPVPATGTMGTLFAVMAHRPDIMQLTMQLLETTMRSGTVDPKLKELLAIRVSQVNHCFY